MEQYYVLTTVTENYEVSLLVFNDTLVCIMRSIISSHLIISLSDQESFKWISIYFSAL